MPSRALLVPQHYSNPLDVLETQRAIKFTKDLFETKLAGALNLSRVSAPMFVRPETGLNDDLSGVERAVAFDVPDAGFSVQVVHSLAKWKRYMLGNYGFSVGQGLYTDMNAIRRDEELDNLHSIYVDQWDWERVIRPEDRNMDTLRQTVCAIVRALYETEQAVCEKFGGLTPFFKPEPYFISAQALLEAYPGLTPREREDAVTREHGVVFLSGIGGALSDGRPHDLRAPDYDDWSLNGDILVWYPVLGRAVELSSMGIRVDPDTLRRQLRIANCVEREKLLFHSLLLGGKLPQTIGGGIGQSRMCMVMLQKAHIGEVQAAVWREEMVETCRQNGIFIL